ncbi:MAG: hypothetical protein JZU65_14690 [Chlorobium sp.]|nr:hypothetical protein [Chlorobium sp.]
MYSTISVLNRVGIEVEFHPMVKDLKGYLARLGSKDAVNMAKAMWVFMVTSEFGLPTAFYLLRCNRLPDSNAQKWITGDSG